MTQGLLCLPAVKHHLILHCTNVSRSVCTHMQTIISLRDTQRASVGSLSSRSSPPGKSSSQWSRDIWRSLGHQAGERWSGEICYIILFNFISSTAISLFFWLVLHFFLHFLSQIKAWISLPEYKYEPLTGLYSCLLVPCSWTRLHQSALLLPAKISCV